MTISMNPHITFPGNAREAMTFYQSVLGGKLDIMAFSDFGGESSVDADLVMHSRLITDDELILMAADMPSGMELRKGLNITIALVGDDSNRLHGFWRDLAEGGEISVPLEKQEWGDEYGRFIDKFGIDWMVNISS